MGTVDVVVVGNSVVVVGSTVVVVVDDVVVVVGGTVVVVGGNVVVVVGARVVDVVLVVVVVVVVLVVDVVVVVVASVVVVFAGSPLKLNSYFSFQPGLLRHTSGCQQQVPARKRYRPGCTSKDMYDCKPRWSSTLTSKLPCSS
jgi:hypothetical protein